MQNPFRSKDSARSIRGSESAGFESVFSMRTLDFLEILSLRLRMKLKMMLIDWFALETMARPKGVFPFLSMMSRLVELCSSSTYTIAA